MVSAPRALPNLIAKQGSSTMGKGYDATMKRHHVASICYTILAPVVQTSDQPIQVKRTGLVSTNSRETRHKSTLADRKDAKHKQMQMTYSRVDGSREAVC